MVEHAALVQDTCKCELRVAAGGANKLQTKCKTFCSPRRHTTTATHDDKGAPTTHRRRAERTHTTQRTTGRSGAGAARAGGTDTTGDSDTTPQTKGLAKDPKCHIMISCFVTGSWGTLACSHKNRTCSDKMYEIPRKKVPNAWKYCSPV